MNYAQVASAVITHEYSDGDQNEYLLDVQKRYPNRLKCCGLIEARTPGYFDQAQHLIHTGFEGLKIPAQRLIMSDKRIYLTTDEMMQMFKLMESKDIFLSIDLADGDIQVAEMEEIIKECPSLRIAIGHFGMVTRDKWQEQIKLARHKNVMIESGGITWLFNDEFYPFKGAVNSIKEAASLVGMEKLMWGSDYPRTIVAVTYKMSYDFVIRSGEFSDKELKMFLGENAVKFYRFEALPDLPYIKNMSE